MPPITGSIEVARNPQDVFDYSADPARREEWQEAVREIDVETAGPPAAGTRVRETRIVPGGPRSFMWEISALEPPNRWSFRGLDGPVRPHGTMRLTPLDGGARTRVDFEIAFEGIGLGKLFAIMARRGAPKQIQSDLENLKRLLEAEGARPSPTPAPN